MAFRPIGSSLFYSPKSHPHPEGKMRMAGPDFWDPFREDRHIQSYRGQRATQIELQTT
jgi:hypothetical protein